MDNRRTSIRNTASELVEWFIQLINESFEIRVPGLTLMYNDESSVRFQGRQLEGRQQIEETQELLRQNCRRKVTAYDSQPTGNGGILLSVSGDVTFPGQGAQAIEEMLDSLELCCSNDSGDAQVLDEHQAHKFHQVFLLMPTPEGSYYVQNDILRMKPPPNPS